MNSVFFFDLPPTIWVSVFCTTSPGLPRQRKNCRGKITFWNLLISLKIVMLCYSLSWNKVFVTGVLCRQTHVTDDAFTIGQNRGKQSRCNFTRTFMSTLTSILTILFFFLAAAIQTGSKSFQMFFFKKQIVGPVGEMLPSVLKK